MKLENTERTLRKREREQEREEPILARVTAVKERHPEVEDRFPSGEQSRTDVVNSYTNRQYEVDLTSQHLTKIAGPDGEESIGESLKDIPVLPSAIGEVGVPEPNRDLAAVMFLDGYNKRNAVVVGFHYYKDDVPPVARRGTWRMQKGKTCFENYEERERDAQDPLPEYIRMAIQDDQTQTVSPDVKAEIREKEPNYGDYTFNVSGDDSDDPSIEVDFEENTIDAVDGADSSVSLDGAGNITAETTSGTSVELNADGSLVLTDSNGSTVKMDGSGTISLDADTIELSGSSDTFTVN